MPQRWSWYRLVVGSSAGFLSCERSPRRSSAVPFVAGTAAVAAHLLVALGCRIVRRGLHHDISTVHLDRDYWGPASTTLQPQLASTTSVGPPSASPTAARLPRRHRWDCAGKSSAATRGSPTTGSSDATPTATADKPTTVPSASALGPAMCSWALHRTHRRSRTPLFARSIARGGWGAAVIPHGLRDPAAGQCDDAQRHEPCGHRQADAQQISDNKIHQEAERETGRSQNDPLTPVAGHHQPSLPSGWRVWGVGTHRRGSFRVSVIQGVHQQYRSSPGRPRLQRTCL